MDNLFNLLKEKYMKYKTEYRDFKDCKVLKIFGSQADQDITVLADETGVILQFMNFHTHFDRDLNDDFEFISESIDEIINDCYFEYEITYNNELIVRGGISTEDFDFRNDSSFFDGVKRYLPLDVMKRDLEYVLKVRSFKGSHNKDLIISVNRIK